MIPIQVIDENTGDPVVFATVILMPDKIGVVSNTDGFFSVPERYWDQNKQLRISCMGYQTLMIPLDEISRVQTAQLGLVEHLEQIDEITLRAERKERKQSARQIVKQAIGSIPENYPRDPHSYVAYYRDYQLVSDSIYLSEEETRHLPTYYNLNEGIIEVFDAGFGTHILFDERNKAAFFRYEENEAFPRDPALSVPYDNRGTKFMDGVIISPLGGNELNLIYLTNAIRNYDIMSFSFVHVLETHFIKNHRFTLEGLEYLDGDPYYRIGFKTGMQKIENTYSGEGIIYISKLDYGIKSLRYDLHDLKKRRHLYGVSIEYLPKDDLYYLNYISFNNYFEAAKQDFFKIIGSDYNVESKSFVVEFNAPLDLTSLEPWARKLKFYQGDRALRVSGVTPLDKNKLSVGVVGIELDENLSTEERLFFEIQGLYDTEGRLLDKTETFTVDQFRELFVQEVFPDKEWDPELIEIEKDSALSSSEINSIKYHRKYWLNTPMRPEK